MSIRVCIALAAITAAVPVVSGSQTPSRPAGPARDSARVKPVKFFEHDDVVTATLTMNSRGVKNDKPDKDDNTPWRTATLRVAGDSAARLIPVRVRGRGIWRLKNCEMPPVRLNFTNDATRGTPFRGLDKPKLVNVCRNSDQYESYLLKEFQLYRIYQLLTPASHQVRLLRLTYVDSASGRAQATRYAFMEEEPNAMAARVGGRITKLKGAMPDDLEPGHDAIVGLFQYLIGNTDFALGALHNAELLTMPNGEYWPVVYDFDFSGAVDARYATVDPSIHTHSVRERVYRGYCVPLETYPPVVALFMAKKPDIYALYRDSLGARLPADDVKATLRYFDEFYQTLADAHDFKANVLDACIDVTRK